MSAKRMLALLLTGTALFASCAFASAFAQERFNEREVKSKRSPLDKGKVWSLDFRFKDPRVLKVHVPGRGTRIIWYMWYQVINRTEEPRTFIPDFELVTRDFPGVWQDEVLTSVHDAIKKIEDPSKYYGIKNSVTISAKPIPHSKVDEAFPRATTGVAIWDASPANVDKNAPKSRDLLDATRFSIFVSGLSNGWVIVDPGDGSKDSLPIVRRKVLQLNFKRIGDRYKLESREFQFVSPAEWTYRPARLRVPLDKAKKP